MKIKTPYIVILILLITNLIAIGYVERYCEINQDHRNKALLNEYLLSLRNEIRGSFDKLKKIYPTITIENNLIIINKNSILRNSHFKDGYKIDSLKNFYGFEFKINKKGKIVASGFHKLKAINNVR